MQYVAADGSQIVAFVYLHSGRFRSPMPPVRLRGLDPAARYRDERTGEVSSGAVLQEHGVEVELRGDFDSAMLHFVREN